MYKVKVAAVQFAPKLKQNNDNLTKMLAKAGKAARSGAKLIVFPECALTGYVFASREEAMPYMESVPGPGTDRLGELCRELDIFIVFGLLEKKGENCFNTAVLLGPNGLVGAYHKTHLPYLGVDRYLDQGEGPLQAYQTDAGSIGLHICYDNTFPEVARTMTLNGAEILILPTNWPSARMAIPRVIIPTRAIENHVYVIAADRVGEERGARFIGNSEIVDPSGKILARAGYDSEEIIYAELDLQMARQKHLIIEPGEFEFDYIADRRPELYGKITEVPS